MSTKVKSNMSLKFKGENEQELINHTKKIYESAQTSLVNTYWWIGKNISGFYQKKHGEETLKKIAKKTGINENTLSKAYKFARQYTKKQMMELITGEIPVSWHIVANNLTIKPEKFMKAYQKSDTTEEFCNVLQKLKKPRQKKEEPDDQGKAPATKPKKPKAGNKGNKPKLKVVKPLKSGDKKSEDKMSEYKYRSKKRNFLLTLKIKEDKAKLIDSKSLKIAFTDIIRQLNKSYIISVTSAPKSIASPKKKKRA